MVSIIVPNYNHGKFLKKRIETILGQTYQDFELIILDDASIDKSVDVINEYIEHPKVAQIILNENNSGSAFSQWNKGLQLAKGDFIWIAESDDYNSKLFLEECMEVLTSNSSISYVFCQSNIVNDEDQVIGDMIDWTNEVQSYNWKENFVVPGNEFIYNALISINVVVNASAVVFKKPSGSIGAIELKKYYYCGDWLFWGLLAHQRQIAYLPQKHNFFRQHIDTTRNIADFSKYLDKIVEEISVRTKLMKMLGSTFPSSVLKDRWGVILNSASLRNYQNLRKKLNAFDLITPRFWTFKFALRALLNFVQFHFFRKGRPRK